MSYLRHVFLVTAIALAGCLATPEPSGPDQTDSPDTGSDTGKDTGRDTGKDTEDVDNVNNTQTDEGPDTCETCTVDARQCGVDDGGNPILQICQPTEVSPTCNRWATAETCVGSQQCSASAGCECTGDDTCVPESPQACPADGVTVCIIVDGCGRTFDIGRADGCSAPDPDDMPLCANDSEARWCAGCDDGRECMKSCDNPRGYTCGVVSTVGF